MLLQKYCYSCGSEVIVKKIKWYGTFDEMTGKQHTGEIFKIICPNNKWWKIFHTVTWLPGNFD